jgi:hypothetical protein
MVPHQQLKWCSSFIYDALMDDNKEMDELNGQNAVLLTDNNSQQ